MDFYLLHMLRPWFLLLLIPAWGLVWLLLKKQDDQSIWKQLIDKKFLPHLLVSQAKQAASIRPAWFIGLLLTLMIIALSGPAWQKQPALFSNDQSEVVFVMKVTDTMLEKDLPPNRLTRAVFKLDDLLRVRSQLKAALVAYSGSAHVVMPMTEDRDILGRFAQSLDPSMMPVKGDALAEAVSQALHQFSGSMGTVIVITDSLAAEQINIIKTDSQLKQAHIILYAAASPELLNLQQMKQAASAIDADLVSLSPDDSDIDQLLNNIDTNFSRAQDDNADYKDEGYLLLPMIVILLVLWFRRGFLAEAWRVS